MIQVKSFEREKKIRIGFYFAYNKPLIDLFKQHEGACWSARDNCWHIPFDFEQYNNLKASIQGVFPDIVIQEDLDASHIKIVSTPIEEKQQKAQQIDSYRKWLEQKRYSSSTIETYVDGIRQFFKFYIDKPISEINNEDVIFFNNEFIIKREFSRSYQTQIISSIKLFYSRIEKRKLNPEIIERPRREHKLPNVLSKEEVGKLLKSLRNDKHSSMLSLIYACGLRRSELIKLKPVDIDSKRKILKVRAGKGMKDRIVPISDKVIEMLRNYYKRYKPKVYLFEGQIEGTPYSETSLQEILKHAVKQANINKPVTLHWLRHSYATHLLENGTDLRYIQEILGHKSSRTTEIYTHVSTKSIQQIRTPFDDL